MSDNRLRPAFKTEDGLPKCIDLLHSCLDDKDWNLACLGMNNQDIICIWHLRVTIHFSFTVCQAIWNYAIDCRKLSDVIEVDHLNELEDILVYLLEVHTYIRGLFRTFGITVPINELLCLKNAGAQISLFFTSDK